MTGPLYAIGRFCSRHHWPVIGVWIVLAIALIAISNAAESNALEIQTSPPGLSIRLAYFQCCCICPLVHHWNGRSVPGGVDTAARAMRHQQRRPNILDRQTLLRVHSDSLPLTRAQTLPDAMRPGCTRGRTIPDAKG